MGTEYNNRQEDKKAMIDGRKIEFADKIQLLEDRNL